MSTEPTNRISRQELATDPDQPMVIKRLLLGTLDKLQPSALKHQRLASVANVVNHPVARRAVTDEYSRQRNVLTIGWADQENTTPLLLVEPASDEVSQWMDDHHADSVDLDPVASSPTSVFHAFVPSVRKPQERDMVELLIEHENNWLRGHELGSQRSIMRELGAKNREEINIRGIRPLDEAASALLVRQKLERMELWYPHRPIGPQEVINHSGAPDLQDYDHDAPAIAMNITRSVNSTYAALRRRDRATRVDISDRGHARGLQVDRMVGRFNQPRPKPETDTEADGPDF